MQATKATELRPKDPDLLVLLGCQLLKSKNVSDAMYNFQVAINVDPSCKEAHIRLADTLSSLGREGEAKSHYEEALRADPNYKWGHVNLGLSLERQVCVLSATRALPAVILVIVSIVVVVVAFAVVAVVVGVGVPDFYNGVVSCWILTFLYAVCPG